MPTLPLSLPRAFFIGVTATHLRLTRYTLSLKGRQVAREFARLEIGEAGLGGALEEVRTRYVPTGDDTWFLGLPLSHFTTVSFTLPAAAAKNLDQAVHYGLMRHVPFDVAEAYTHYTATPLETPQGRPEASKLAVTAMVALRRDLAPYLEAVSRAGISLSVVCPSLIFAAAGNGKNGIYLSGGPDPDAGPNALQAELECIYYKDGAVVFEAAEEARDQDEARDFLTRTGSGLAAVPGARDALVFLQDCPLPGEMINSALGVPKVMLTPLGDPPQAMNADPGRTTRHLPYQIDLVPASVREGRRRAFFAQAGAMALLLLALATLPLAGVLGKHVHLSRIEGAIEALSDESAEYSKSRKRIEEQTELLAAIGDFAKNRPAVADHLKELTELVGPPTWLESYIYADGRILLHGVGSSATNVLGVVEGSPLFSEARFDAPVTPRFGYEEFKIVARVNR